MHQDRRVGPAPVALLVDPEHQEVQGPFDVLARGELGPLVAEQVLGLDGVVEHVEADLRRQRAAARHDHDQRAARHHRLSPPR